MQVRASRGFYSHVFRFVNLQLLECHCSCFSTVHAIAKLVHSVALFCSRMLALVAASVRKELHCCMLKQPLILDVRTFGILILACMVDHFPALWHYWHYSLYIICLHAANIKMYVHMCVFNSYSSFMHVASCSFYTTTSAPYRGGTYRCMTGSDVSLLMNPLLCNTHTC